MNVSLEVKNNISMLKPGKIINIEELSLVPDSKTVVLKVLSKMAKIGKIKRAERGVYYIPKNSIFGEIPLSDEEIIKKYLFEGKRRIGYITGNNLFNKYGLTTQVASKVEVAVNKRKNPKKYKNIEIKFVYQKAPITDKNIKYLEILDILKNIKKIPDADIIESYNTIKKQILKFTYEELMELLDLAENYYTVSVVALLGSMIEEKNILRVNKIREKLNKTTSFKIGLDIKKWRII